jgi:hypothetical protein
VHRLGARLVDVAGLGVGLPQPAAAQRNLADVAVSYPVDRVQQQGCRAIGLVESGEASARSMTSRLVICRCLRMA